MRRPVGSVVIIATTTATIMTATRPIMGWSTWNTFGQTISDSAMREVADAMVSKGLRDAGYTYVNIDDGWGANDRNGSDF